MTTISKCLIAILITAISPSLYAQDLHISQYPSAPMHLDPSMTGMAYDGTMVSLHYRTQWSPILGADNAFSTMSASAEHRRNVKKTDFFSYGLGVWTDKAAAIKLTQAKIAVSYARQLAGTNKVQHYLVGGGDVSLMQRVIDFTDRQWVNQYDGNGGHDPNRLAPTFDFPNKTTYDVSAGISWYSLLRNSNYLALGLTAQHLNRADLGLQKRTIQANLFSTPVSTCGILTGSCF